MFRISTHSFSETNSDELPIAAMPTKCIRRVPKDLLTLLVLNGLHWVSKR